MFRAIADTLSRFCARRALEDLERRGLAHEPAAGAPPALSPEQLDQISGRLLEAARRTAPAATVAAVQHARRIVVRTFVDTDAEKSALADDERYRALYRESLLEAGYPPDDADRYCRTDLDFESEETLGRAHGEARRWASA